MTEEHVPCRIQIWHENTMIEVRGYLDEFSASTDPIRQDFGSVTGYVPGRKSYTLHMSDHTRLPWKFERGKPKVTG
jgi:hypothetical protein